MDTERLKTLMKVLECGSISAAAAALDYTPSGVSRMIQALEEEIGFPLLYRSREGAAPTEELRKILPNIERMLYSGEALLQACREIRGLHTGTVRIGTAYSSYYSVLYRRINAFREQYPGIEFRLKSGYTQELLEELYARRLDLCIVSRRDGPHLFENLIRDEVCAWVSARHPLARGEAVPLSAYGTETYVDIHSGKDVDNARILRQAGVTVRRRMEASDSLSAYYMVEAGLGIAMNNHINTLLVGEGVRVMPLEPRQSVEIDAAWMEDLSPAAGKFLPAFLSAAKGLTG